MEKTIKLNLASGNKYLDGYINIDNHSMTHGKVDKLKNILTLKWKSNTVDEILLSHFAMYIHPHEAPLLFQRWYEWLKPMGKLVIETGDLKKICKTILDSEEQGIINGTDGVMQLFGWAETKGHRWAWCKDTLVPILKSVGFQSFEFQDGGTHNRPERDITIIAFK